MTLSIGDRLPAATFTEMGADGPGEVAGDALFSGRKVVLFAVPGAFTGTCSARHVPSFVRTADAFRAKGVDEIVCLAVNDPFVLGAWSEATGAGAAGIRMLGDADSAFTRAVGMEFSNPARGLIGRSKRYALVAEDGVVRLLNVEESPGQCEASAGETLLAAI
jgi:peroxiredoxin